MIRRQVGEEQFKASPILTSHLDHTASLKEILGPTEEKEIMKQEQEEHEITSLCGAALVDP